MVEKETSQENPMETAPKRCSIASLSNEEIRQMVGTIMRDCSDERSLRLNIRKVLGYHGPLVVDTVTTHGHDTEKPTFQVKLHGPRGNTISV
jgi:hypothetical protein